MVPRLFLRSLQHLADGGHERSHFFDFFRSRLGDWDHGAPPGLRGSN
jgi:hypothetical protein